VDRAVSCLGRAFQCRARAGPAGLAHLENFTAAVDLTVTVTVDLSIITPWHMYLCSVVANANTPYCLKNDHPGLRPLAIIYIALI
jgi:hypothetical protein